MNAVRLGFVDPKAALYGYWLQWRTLNESGRPLLMGDALQLTGERSATSLHSSAPSLVNALTTRLSTDAATYLNQAPATYPEGVSELDAALHLLHPPDKELGVGEETIFVERANEALPRPRLTNPVYDGTRPTPPYALENKPFPPEPTWCSPSNQPPRPPAGGPTHTCPPASPGPGALTTEDRSSNKSAQAPPCSSTLSRPAETRSWS